MQKFHRLEKERRLIRQADQPRIQPDRITQLYHHRTLEPYHRRLRRIKLELRGSGR